MATLALVGLALVVVVFAWLVWPTPWRAIAVRSSRADVLAAREHRLTGRVELLTVRGWRALPLTASTTTTRPPLASAPDSTDPLRDYRAGWRDTVR